MRNRNDHTQAPSSAKFQVIGTYFSMDTTEDFYDEGAVGGPDDSSVLFESNFGTFDSLEELIKFVADRTGVSADPKHWESMEDGRIATAITVDENNYQADERDMEAFKRGEKRLWVADVSAGVSYANVWEPDEDTLSKATVLSGKKATNPAPGNAPNLKSRLLR